MILTPRSGRTARARRPGYVIIAVLIVIVLLSLMAYRFTDGMTAEYRAGVRTSDAAQARAAAVSGVWYAAALLADPDAFADSLGGDPTLDNPSVFSDVAVRTDADRPNKDAKFRVVAVAVTGPGAYEQRAALTDEGGKLNINALIAQDPTGEVLYNALMMLPDMTADVADSVVDWVDADQNARGEGAEASYYQGLANPYKCKDGPLNSLDELLLVKGVTPQLLYGTDQNRNGDGDEGGSVDRGWSDYLTVFGREVSVDSSGQIKINVKNNDLQALYDALLGSGIGDELAAYVMAARLVTPTRLNADGTPASGNTQNQEVRQASLADLTAFVDEKLQASTNTSRALNSVLDLVNTRVSFSIPNGDGKSTTAVYNSPLNDPAKLREVLPVLLDKLATREEVEMIPRLNVNTAPREVLLGLPGVEQGTTLDEADVDAIVEARGSAAAGTLEYSTGAWLVTQANLTPEKFKAIEKYVTGSSMVYRVQSVGYLTGGGPVARVEAVIDVNLGSPRVVYFRDLGDLDNPRGFQPPRPGGP